MGETISGRTPESIEDKLTELAGRAEASWAWSQRLQESYLEALSRREAARDEYQRILSTIQQRRSTPNRQRLTSSATARLMARLASLPVIEQAKGILMAQSAITADEAFDRLRRASQRSNVPVREIADKIVTANRGEAPRRS